MIIFSFCNKSRLFFMTLHITELVHILAFSLFVDLLVVSDNVFTHAWTVTGDFDLG